MAASETVRFPSLGVLLVVASPGIGGCLRSTSEIPPPGEGVVIGGSVVARELATAELAPIDGASVRVLGTGARRVTNSDGYFQLERLPLGRHRLAIEVRGAGGRPASGRLLEPVNALFDGQTINLGTIELYGTGGLAGEVRLRSAMGSERTAPGALVVAAETGFKAITGESGRFELGGLPEGTVDVVAFFAGHLPARALGVRVGAGTRSEVSPLVLVASDDVPPTLVRGIATLAGAADSAGIAVTFTPETSTSALPIDALTDGTGSYTLTAPAGVYRARFAAAGYQTVLTEGIAVLPEGVLGLRPVVLLRAIEGDLDGDGIPDAEDADRDGDGCAGELDRFPDDPGACGDNDGDGVPDEWDPDDDDDGLDDAEEESPGRDGFITDPLSDNSDGDGTTDRLDTCPTVAFENAEQDSDGDGVPDDCDPRDDRGTAPPEDPPELFDFSPRQAAAGVELTITGARFSVEDRAFTAVRFGPGGPIVSPATISRSELTVLVPEDALDGPLSIYSGGYVLTTSAPFDFLPGPALLDFSPRVARPGEVISLYGRGFEAPGLSVFFGAEPGTLELDESGALVSQALYGGELLDRLRVRVPRSVATPTTAVSVVNDFGRSTAPRLLTATRGLAVLQISPNPAPPGTTVVVRGRGLGLSGFSGEVTVEFGGGSIATPLSEPSETSLSVVVPAGALTGPVTVHHPSGDGVSTFDFIADTSQPYAIDLRPWLAKEGESVVISGGNLAGPSGVTFGGVAGTISNASGGVVTAVVPAGAAPGEVVLTYPGTPPRTVVAPRRLALLRRTEVMSPTIQTGLGFSADGRRLFAVSQRQGLTLDAELLTQAEAPVELSFLSAGSLGVYFQVSPSGTTGILVQSAPVATHVVALPAFSAPSTTPCSDAFLATYHELRFTADSRAAYSPRPQSVAAGLDGVFEIDVATGGCAVLGGGPQRSGAPINAVLPSLDPSQLIVAHSTQGMASMEIAPGSPLLGALTSPFPGSGGVTHVPLFWGPGFTTLWGATNVASIARYEPFSTEAPTIVAADIGRAVQSDNLRWLFKGSSIIDLEVGERVRTGEPDLAVHFGGAARGTAVVIPRTNGAGLVRFEILE